MLKTRREQNRIRRGMVFAAVVLAAGARAEPAEVEVAVAAANSEAFFERKIRPVLAGTCFRCHGGERTGGKLRIDSRAALLKGGESGPALVPGAPDESLLIQALRREDDTLKMPPDKPLPPEVVQDFTAWVRAGASWPATASAAFVPRRHWAFEPVRAVEPPADPSGQSSSPIDRFLAARQRDRGLSPLGKADQRTMLRRVTFDLTGLPPTPEEVDSFLADEGPAAFARVVDRLLASPHYGERWGRHWLDVVRYADTAGETADFPVPPAWRYRDYVINAFNRDKPYDEFLREQVAGDLMARQLPPSAPRARFAELIVATGYLSIARRFGFDTLKDHYLTIEDTIDVLGKSMVGLTIACARCHDHKYDPINQTDYYGLYGIFESTRYPFPGCEKEKKSHDLVSMVPPWDQGSKTVDLAYAVAEGAPHDAQIHRRGNPDDRGDATPRRWLAVLGGQGLPSAAGSGRAELAEWLTSPGNPLTARVLVNRLWQHHFGQGLVKTPNDFGTRGSPPSHPELLDYLAARFVADGWSIKAMQRLIVLSDAYQRASGDDERNARIDPENTGLWRSSRRRLSAEEIRDAVLAVCGDLDRTPGGPHPFPDPATWQFTQHNPFSATYDHNRRGVYLMTQRIKRHPFLALFDGADPNSSTEARQATTVPTQALFFLNDPFVHTRSAHLADRLMGLGDDSARLDRAFALCFGRAPSGPERQEAERFLNGYEAALAPGDARDRHRSAWAAWLRVLLASNEFLHVD